jgi:hypothetical protein
MNRAVYENLFRGEEANARRVVVKKVLGSSRYLVVDGSGSVYPLSVAAGVARVFAPGDTVRQINNEIVGVVQASSNVQVYEV